MSQGETRDWQTDTPQTKEEFLEFLRQSYQDKQRRDAEPRYRRPGSGQGDTG